MGVGSLTVVLGGSALREAVDHFVGELQAKEGRGVDGDGIGGHRP